MIQSEGPPELEDLSCSVTLYHAILLYFYMMFKIIVLNLFIRYSQGAENWKASLWDWSYNTGKNSKIHV